MMICIYIYNSSPNSVSTLWGGKCKGRGLGWIRVLHLRLAQNVRLTSGARHFPREFSHKMAFVRCQCAFPLRSRRLAQNVGPGLGIHLLPSSFLVKIFLQSSKGSLHDLVHVRRSREILVRSFVGGSSHDLVQVLVRRSCGD